MQKFVPYVVEDVCILFLRKNKLLLISVFELAAKNAVKINT